VPLPVVQGVVGHLDAAMTKRYMDHATRRDKQTALARIPNYLNGKDVSATAGADPQAALHARTDKATPEQAARWLALIDRAERKSKNRAM